MKEVPYCTSDNEEEWCGHIWRQRRSPSGPWGFGWQVIAPFDEAVSSGWASTQELAERAMNNALERNKQRKEAT